MNDRVSPALEARDLVKHFETGAGHVEVLAGVDLTLAAGESLAITGPSGSGKSTFLHIVGTLEPPTSGSLRIDGDDPFALDEPSIAAFRNRAIGFVFQEHYLLPHLTVHENVLLPSLAAGHDAQGRDARGGGDDASARARSLVERVGLGHRLEHRPAELSGGERQRAAVARALINRPRLVLCDEPTGSLDQENAEAIGDLLSELPTSGDVTLIVVTHSARLAERFERQVAIAEGRFRDRGTAESVERG